MRDFIRVIRSFQLGDTVAVVLRIATDRKLPIVVGCSVKWGGADGSVQDIPVRRLKKQGDVAWIIPMPPDAGDPILRFSTWKNETFSERMDDTGWVEHGTEESKMVRPFGGKDTCMATNIIDACGSEEDCWY